MRYTVFFKRLPSNLDLPLPARATEQSAGYDVCSAEEEFMIEPREIKLVSTGLVRPRSGLALRDGIIIPNSPGTIDPDYRGELGIIMQNNGNKSVRIKRGDRIAQLVFHSFEVPEVIESGDIGITARGTDGFGSTGR